MKNENIPFEIWRFQWMTLCVYFDFEYISLNRKLRVYLIGLKDKKQIGLQLGDSSKKMLERIKRLLKVEWSDIKLTAKFDYRGEQITSEGKG